MKFHHTHLRSPLWNTARAKLHPRAASLVCALLLPLTVEAQEPSPLAMRPAVGTPSDTQGCCANRTGRRAWTCFANTYEVCEMVGRACEGQPRGDAYCSDDDWGFEVRLSGNECRLVCEDWRDTEQSRLQLFDLIGEYLPTGPVARYVLAGELVTQQRCADAQLVINELPPYFANDPHNHQSLQYLRAQCLLLEGVIDDAERIYRDGFAAGYSLNPATPASGVSAILASQCDFDGARQWAFIAQRNAAAYLAGNALVQSASLELLNGRPEAARISARSYLDEYPVDWYSLPASTPPASVYFDRAQANESHLEIRVIAHLIASLDGSPPQITQPERSTLNALIERDLTSASNDISDWGNDAGHSLATLSAAVLATLALESAAEFGLSSAQISRLNELQSDSLRELRNSEGTCQRGAENVLALAAPPATGELIEATTNPDDSRVRVELRQIVIDEQIHFQTDSATILGDSHSILQAVADLLIRSPSIARVRIDGHTDARGESSYNVELSARRAQSVLEHLVSLGVDASRLEFSGFGESVPLSLRDDELGWQVNRRVEFTILE